MHPFQSGIEAKVPECHQCTWVYCVRRRMFRLKFIHNMMCPKHTKFWRK